MQGLLAVKSRHTCVQALLFQVGTNEAMVRFSMAVVPGGMKPPGLNTLWDSNRRDVA